MMSPRDILIGSTVILASLVLATSYDCPDFCICTVAHEQNHAKCQSLEGLKTEGKHIPLHSIDLSNASIARITNHLEKFRDLISLDLSHNQLSEVGKLGRRIKVLNLSHNKITSGKLSKIPSHVEDLDLSNNEITYLPLELMKLQSLKSIELTNNAINCTCETLEVRNWLQGNHVWTDNHIKCSYPMEFKGQPWLQVKRPDSCDQTSLPRSIALTQEIATDDENELMLGDQPILNEGSGQGNEDELEKDFLPFDDKKEKKADDTADLNIDTEGSGDIFSVSDTERGTSADLAMNATSSDDVEAQLPEMGSGGNELDEDEQGRLMESDDEGSGSGMGIFIPDVRIEDEHTTPSGFADDDDINENTPVAPPQEEATQSAADIFGPGLGIMSPEETTRSPVSEEAVVAVNVPKTGSQPDEVDGPAHGDEVDGEQNSKIVVSEKIGNIEEANAGTSRNTYILLAVVLILLVVLIVFVAVKRRRMSRQRDRDAENPRSTELIDMNKKNLGKPVHKNGAPEHIPLMGDRAKEDFAKPISGEKKTPYKPSQETDGKAQEPLLGDQSSKPESNNNVAPVEPTQERKSIGAQNTEPIHKPNSQTLPANTSLPPGDDDVFLPSSSSPSSPKASRYSPVYSPETGRVKIKLLETPKPKTPLLVTRSRSNAGDVITTPNGNILQTPDQRH